MWNTTYSQRFKVLLDKEDNSTRTNIGCEFHQKFSTPSKNMWNKDSKYYSTKKTTVLALFTSEQFAASSLSADLSSPPETVSTKLQSHCSIGKCHKSKKPVKQHPGC